MYALIESERMAVVRALNKVRFFVLVSSDLMIFTYHKPLLKILWDRSLEDIHNPRLLSLKERMLLFNFKVLHLTGKENNGADDISKFPSQEPAQSTKEDDIINTKEVVLEIASPAVSFLTPDHVHSMSLDKVGQTTLSKPLMKYFFSLI